MADVEQGPGQPELPLEALPAVEAQGPGEGAPASAPEDRRSATERFRDGFRANRTAVLWIVPLAFGVMALAWYWLNAEAPAPPASRFDPGSTVASNPLEPTSPAYREAMQADETVRREEAVETGESYVPTFQSQTGQEQAGVAAPVMPSARAPSVAVTRPAAEQREPVAAQPPPEEEDPMLQQDYPVAEERGTELVRRELAEGEGAALGAMFEELLTRWNAPPEMTLIRYEVEQGQGGATGTVGAGAGAGVDQSAAAPPPPGMALVAAGRMLYASTKVGVDSELGLPVLVELHEKPFRGALLTGEFRQVRERMVVQFTRLSDPRRDLEVTVNAYAVGLKCECGAVEGEVDSHWIARVVLPAAFGFAEEYLRAAGEPDTRIIVDGEVVAEYSDDEVKDRIARGLAGAVGQAGDVVLEGLPKRATVRLPRGTELAVVFVDPVREERKGRG